jgi:hypothetical protein
LVKTSPWCPRLHWNDARGESGPHHAARGGLTWCPLDDSQVDDINCSTFKYIKVCRTHEELKVLVSKFNKKIYKKQVFWV